MSKAYRTWYDFLLRNMKQAFAPDAPETPDDKLGIAAIFGAILGQPELPHKAPKTKEELLANYDAIEKRGVLILQRRDADWSSVDVIDDFGFRLVHVDFDAAHNRIRITFHNEHPKVAPTSMELPYDGTLLSAAFKHHLVEHAKRSRLHHRVRLIEQWDKEHPTNG